MKKTFLIIISALLFSAISAQNEDAEAVFEKITKEYTLNTDGSMDFRCVKQLKLQSYLSFNRLYGETFIIYNTDFQTLKINEAYTIMADSTKVVTPPNAFNEVLPFEAAHSASNNFLREMVVTHTALEIGATIYLDYTITSIIGFLPALMGNEIIEESSPVQEMEIIVKVPTDVELFHKMYNLRTAPEVMIMGSQKVYTWKFSGVKAAPQESFRSRYLENVPRLSFSTIEKMEDVILHITSQPAFNLVLSDEMMAFADTVRKQNQDEIKVLTSIQKEVAENMATIRTSLKYTGFRVRTPEETWQSNGGTELEKAVLFSALLNRVNIPSRPVLACPSAFYDEKIGNLLLLEGAYVLASTKSQGDIYLSVNSLNEQNLATSLTNEVLAGLEKDRPFTTYQPNPPKNEILVSGDFSISDSLEMTGKMHLEIAGNANPFLAMNANKTVIKDKISGNLVKKGDNSVKILNSNDAKSEIDLEVCKDEPFSEKAGLYRFDIPLMKNGFESWHISFAETTRTDPFFLPGEQTEKYSFTLTLPDGFEFVNKKENVNINNKAGSVRIIISAKGEKVIIERELRLTKKTIEPDEFGDFRALVNEWLDKNFRMIVVEKN